MTQYFLNVSTIFSQYTELERGGYIVWHILKELNLFLPRKVLVHWIWNYNVLNKYWVSNQGSVPSEIQNSVVIQGRVLANSDGPALTCLKLTIHMADNEANTLVSSLMSDRADSLILKGVSLSMVLPGA